ncbi:MAG: CoA-binding protein [Chlorobi bacterium]|nr:CoA-binding protein [Chlorobiota bacterium]
MDEKIKEILETAKTVAVVGISAKPERDSYGVAQYLINAGYTVIPVNPMLSEWEGLPCYPDLTSIPNPDVDIVDVFRAPEHVPEIVSQAFAIRAKTVWLQFGVSNPAAEEDARKAGLNVVSNLCIKIEHMRLLGG